MNHKHVLAAGILSKSNPSLLRRAVPVVWNRERQWIAKDFGGSLEIYSMLVEIDSRLRGIPFKFIEKSGRPLRFILA